MLLITIKIYKVERNLIINRSRGLGSSAEELWKELNSRYNVTKLVQEVGEVTSVVQDETEIASAVSDSMSKYLDYERGAILLEGKDGEGSDGVPRPQPHQPTPCTGHPPSPIQCTRYPAGGHHSLPKTSVSFARVQARTPSRQQIADRNYSCPCRRENGLLESLFGSAIFVACRGRGEQFQLKTSTNYHVSVGTRLFVMNTTDSSN